MIAAALRAGPRALVSFAAERPGAAIAGFVLGVVALAALLAPLIAAHDPFDLASFDVLDANLPPVWLEGSDPRFLLGTDAQGRDLLSAILYGTRISLTVGVLAVLIQAAIGVPLGLLAGYTGGRTDTLVSRAADIQLSLSTLMLAIIALALFRAGLGGESLSRYAVPLLVVVIGLAEWPYFARTARAATQVEAAKDYVRAGRALGATNLAHHGAPYPPQYPFAADRRGDHASRGRHHGRGGALVFGPRHAGDQTVARHSDPLRLRSDIRRRLVGDGHSGAGAHRRSDLHQCAWRRFARCA